MEFIDLWAGLSSFGGTMPKVPMRTIHRHRSSSRQSITLDGNTCPFCGSPSVKENVRVYTGSKYVDKVIHRCTRRASCKAVVEVA